MGKTVMVTGAGGFLGRNLVAKLASCGHSVYAVTSKDEAELGVSGLSAVVGNRDFEAIGALLDGTDVLFNCAFPRNVDGYQLAEGMDYLQRLFEAAGKSRVGAVVNISSQSVYSQTRTEPAREDTPVCLESKYAVAKYASEQLLDAHCREVPHTNIRLASLIGPGFDQRVVNKMARGAVRSGRIVLNGGNRIFDYMDVLDAVNALGCMTGSEPVSWDAAYNLCSSQPRSLEELAKDVVRSLRVMGLSCDLVVEGLNPSDYSSALDATAFVRHFAWLPHYPIDETVDRIVKDAIAQEPSLDSVE